MMQLQVLPRELARQSISQQEIVLPLDAVIAAIDYCANHGIRILGWEGWIQSSDGRVGHGNAPQGTTNLAHLTMVEAADFCRRTIRAAATAWSESCPGTTDRLYFCVTIDTTGAKTMP
ncbi:hypothetical protein WJ39_05015 [Burkholderia diffusa]|nr:hypothetical protein WJ39_05015 [Burkholderia diffusa]